MRNRHRSLLISLMAVALALAATACTTYHASVVPVTDEIIVKLVTEPVANYSHPVQINANQLAAIFENVLVKYKANWLQTLLTGPLKPVPLFEPTTLPKVISPLVRAFAQATSRDRIVFYVAERRSDVRREVTSGSLFVTGQLLHIVVMNHRNGVDVIPGVPTYDQKNPEIAVAPQRFILAFDRPEFVVDPNAPFMRRVFSAAPPSLVVDYRQFLSARAQERRSPSLPASVSLR